MFYPFTRPQIEHFIQKWYQLRPEWVGQYAQGIKQFMQALNDSHRGLFIIVGASPHFSVFNGFGTLYS